jgi:hypothetical protein
MIQFPSRKEAEILVRVPLSGTDTSSYADQLEIPPDEMYHYLSALKRKHFLGVRRSRNYKTLKSHRWVLTERGKDLQDYMKKHGQGR